MLEQAGRQTSLNLHASTPIVAMRRRIGWQIGNASMVVLNFTLQFIPPHARLQLLTNIRKGTASGACWCYRKKSPSGWAGSPADRMHHAFKRANGYNDLEISRKRSALEMC